MMTWTTRQPPSCARGCLRRQVILQETMMNFVRKVMNLVLEMMNFALKVMNFAEHPSLAVNLEMFMYLVGGAEQHPAFSFVHMLSGVREVLAAGSLFKAMVKAKDIYATGRATIVELALLVQDLGVLLTVQQTRELWGQLIGEMNHSAKSLKSITFVDLLEGMEVLRRISTTMGAVTTRLFRKGAMDKYGPGLHIDRLLERFLSGGDQKEGDQKDLESSAVEGLKCHLKVKMAFDACDRATGSTGFIDAGICGLIIVSKIMNFIFSKNKELCIENKEVCIQNDEFCSTRSCTRLTTRNRPTTSQNNRRMST